MVAMVWIQTGLGVASLTRNKLVCFPTQLPRGYRSSTRFLVDINYGLASREYSQPLTIVLTAPSNRLRRTSWLLAGW